MTTASPRYAFDQSNTRWFPLGEFKHLELAMLGVDRRNKIVDFMVKFHANGVIFNHRHLAETRPTGSYTVSAPGGVHSEGAGEVDCIVIYNIRGNGSDEMFDVLDEAGQAVGKIGFEDFATLYEVQKGPG
jgi:2,4'-dihydroxyacetophenone dioxygenase